MYWTFDSHFSLRAQGSPKGEYYVASWLSDRTTGEVSPSAANLLAAYPPLFTTLNHHVNEGYSTTDGVN